MSPMAEGPFGSLEDWWMGKSKVLADAVVPKMEEYGSDDLTEIGGQILDIARRQSASERQKHEAGVFFYVLGKTARWSHAMKKGKFVSDDTLHDIITYCMMVLDRRENGAR